MKIKSINKSARTIATVLFVGAMLLSMTLSVNADQTQSKLYMSIEEAVTAGDSAKRVCLGGRNLGEIPSVLGECRNIEEINISLDNLSAIPDFVCNYKNLADFRASGNSLIDIPQCFANFQKLKYLDLSSNSSLNFERVIAVLKTCKSLEELDVSFCEISAIPGNIAEMKHLKKLNLAGNKLAPDEIKNLKNALPDTAVEN